jgi:hypothetical protein
MATYDKYPLVSTPSPSIFHQALYITSGVWRAYAHRSSFFTIMFNLNQKMRLILVYTIYSVEVQF